MNGVPKTPSNQNKADKLKQQLTAAETKLDNLAQSAASDKDKTLITEEIAQQGEKKAQVAAELVAMGEMEEDEPKVKPSADQVKIKELRKEEEAYHNLLAQADNPRDKQIYRESLEETREKIVQAEEKIALANLPETAETTQQEPEATPGPTPEDEAKTKAAEEKKAAHEERLRQLRATLNAEANIGHVTEPESGSAEDVENFRSTDKTTTAEWEAAQKAGDKAKIQKLTEEQKEMEYNESVLNPNASPLKAVEHKVSIDKDYTKAYTSVIEGQQAKEEKMESDAEEVNTWAERAVEDLPKEQPPTPPPSPEKPKPVEDSEEVKRETKEAVVKAEAFGLETGLSDLNELQKYLDGVDDSKLDEIKQNLETRMETRRLMEEKKNEATYRGETQGIPKKQRRVHEAETKRFNDLIAEQDDAIKIINERLNKVPPPPPPPEPKKPDTSAIPLEDIPKKPQPKADPNKIPLEDVPPPPAPPPAPTPAPAPQPEKVDVKNHPTLNRIRTRMAAIQKQIAAREREKNRILGKKGVISDQEYDKTRELGDQISTRQADLRDLQEELNETRDDLVNRPPQEPEPAPEPTPAPAPTTKVKANGGEALKKKPEAAPKKGKKKLGTADNVVVPPPTPAPVTEAYDVKGVPPGPVGVTEPAPQEEPDAGLFKEPAPVASTASGGGRPPKPPGPATGGESQQEALDRLKQDELNELKYRKENADKALRDSEEDQNKYLRINAENTAQGITDLGVIGILANLRETIQGIKEERERLDRAIARLSGAPASEAKTPETKPASQWIESSPDEVLKLAQAHQDLLDFVEHIDIATASDEKLLEYYDALHLIPQVTPQNQLAEKSRAIANKIQAELVQRGTYDTLAPETVVESREISEHEKQFLTQAETIDLDKMSKKKLEELLFSLRNTESYSLATFNRNKDHAKRSMAAAARIEDAIKKRGVLKSAKLLLKKIKIPKIKVPKWMWRSSNIRPPEAAPAPVTPPTPDTAAPRPAEPPLFPEEIAELRKNNEFLEFAGRINNWETHARELKRVFKHLPTLKAEVKRLYKDVIKNETKTKVSTSGDEISPFEGAEGALANKKLGFLDEEVEKVIAAEINATGKSETINIVEGHAALQEDIAKKEKVISDYIRENNVPTLEETRRQLAEMKPELDKKKKKVEGYQQMMGGIYNVSKLKLVPRYKRHLAATISRGLFDKLLFKKTASPKKPGYKKQAYDALQGLLTEFKEDFDPNEAPEKMMDMQYLRPLYYKLQNELIPQAEREIGQLQPQYDKLKQVEDDLAEKDAELTALKVNAAQLHRTALQEAFPPTKALQQHIRKETVLYFKDPDKFEKEEGSLPKKIQEVYEHLIKLVKDPDLEKRYIGSSRNKIPKPEDLEKRVIELTREQVKEKAAAVFKKNDKTDQRLRGALKNFLAAGQIGSLTGEDLKDLKREILRDVQREIHRPDPNVVPPPVNILKAIIEEDLK